MIFVAVHRFRVHRFSVKNKDKIEDPEGWENRVSLPNSVQWASHCQTWNDAPLGFASEHDPEIGIGGQEWNPEPQNP